MAQAHVSDVKLRLVFVDGLKEDGSPNIKRKTLSRIRLGASADELFITSRAFASLSSYSLMDTERVETAQIQSI
ncbi:DUF1659 domain-containing protein [Jeotgalibacillus proteolyticus]|uniref:DUF1659 domain-containing protein n=1 Tax=Jeotgalibacillus proteolyticus TaxID=2082395 RepID=A0A2S5GD11_9BACL|nr:DUF1659 domain-containing protein [Jeotgalibacillus proteolyticus]PPA70794.1 hypothetical protein C4B60_08355 [Jeotgalibacillus proteolyticus]